MELEIINYLYSDETLKFSEWVNRRNLELSDVQSPRVLNHWEKNKLIPLSGSYERYERRNYNLVDLLWLLILKELREFGLSFKSLYSTKNFISVFPSRDNLQSILSETNIPDDYYKTVKKRALASTNFSLEFALYQCFVERKLTYLVINSVGEAKVLTHTSYLHEINNMELSSSLVVNIHSIVQKIFPKRDISPAPKNKSNKIDHNLLQVMFELYNSDASQVDLKLKDGSIEQMNITSYEDIDIALEHIAKKGDYQDITISIEKGKKQYIKRVKKVKL